MKIDKSLDQVILVDEHDQQIGVMDKIEAHRHPAQLHRASSVLLHNSRGEWLIQQRSEYKIVGAGQWANTCCGNVRPRESYEECAQRRLREELGIVEVKLEKLAKFTYQVECNEEFGENEIDMIFVGEYEGLVKPSSKEVKKVRWLSAPDLLAELDKNQANFTPWTKLVLNLHPDFIKE